MSDGLTQPPPPCNAMLSIQGENRTGQESTEGVTKLGAGEEDSRSGRELLLGVPASEQEDSTRKAEIDRGQKNQSADLCL